MEVLPNYLFANYILEIYRWLSQRFATIKYDEEMEAKTLQVFYGQPRAAFRSLQNKFNGKIVLPMLNFYIANPVRDLKRERPGVMITDSSSYDPTSKTISRMRVPMHFDVTFSVNLWTDNLKDQNYIIHEILQMMPGGELCLIFFTNTEIVNDKVVIKDRKDYILMPIKIGESFTDETEIESLEESQVRERIKTTFELSAHTIVPYNVARVQALDSMSIITMINGEPTTKEIFDEDDFR